MPLVKITDEISYLPASEHPLSADVVFITLKNQSTWIFDVGTCGEAAELINAAKGTKNIVLSHFHPDHVLNLARIKYDNLYVSKNTKKYVRAGTIVENHLEINLEQENAENAVETTSAAGADISQASESGKKITILELPSSHAKGSLLLVYGDYAFLGDGTYWKIQLKKHSYNVQLLKQMIELLEKLPVKYFCLSHEKKFVQEKEKVISRYKEIYSLRNPDSPEIEMGEF